MSARLTRGDEEKLNLDLARYFSTTGDFGKTLEHARKALAANPKSIPAHILVGEIKERQGDPEGALAAYQKATTEFYKQYPDSYELPQYLIHKTSDLMERLGKLKPKE